ncbi:nitroreductase family deazaflavin-dependent oxidoreductase [Salinibacterium sp. G-O1]|uniref:nitroreductase family deazaflavin-dependent oxidoreductase n=1 Tax=Salinibacterium sp. G-O1 TaxID=3046208 RepID=UPI0024BBCF72|nr:nitroreductase family deazaflavin-dependent oxidoreductase [Salinibacterium sp. G-O1]MDJ0335845.1 nitroreductase family deazaflavin-dependent oxidoreductase [Salinibacterium sp. G-O1]
MPRTSAAPSSGAMNAMNRIHRALIRLTRGRVGWHLSGMPMLELTTTGRTSGEPRSTMLSSPLQPGGSYVVVASRGGDDKHPAWYLNLVANPAVEVDYQGGGKQKRLARVATATERAELWSVVTADHKNYAQYQSRTDRQIPLVFLDPVG